MDTMTKHHHCCDDDPSCISGSRNRYFRRKVMTAEDFTREQAYMISRRRLINRAMFGWGVVFGLGVEAEGGQLTVDCGLAFDPHGREIGLPVPYTVRKRDLFVLEEGKCKPSEAPLSKGKWLLSAHYAERPIDPVRLPDACGDCGCPEWSRICETVIFSLKRVEGVCCPPYHDACPEDCGCPPPECVEPTDTSEPPPPPEQKYSEAPPEQQHPPEPANSKQQTQRRQAARPAQQRADVRQQDLRQQQSPPDEGQQPPDKGEWPPEQKPPEEEPPEEKPSEQDECESVSLPPYPRGPQHTLCGWSRNADVECDDGHLCAWDELCLDPCDPVPLACVEIVDIDKCGDPVFGEVEECPPRRIVKRNDMLFDLIRGCDLTRITRISWVDWAQGEGIVTWKEFRDSFKENDTAGLDDPENECRTEFEIEFSGPVLIDTLRPGVLTITAFFRETSSGWGVPYRVPISRLLWDPPTGNDPADTTRKAVVVVRRSWFRDEIENLRQRDSKFDVDYERPRRYPLVEVTIDGNRILACSRMQLDANANGPAIVPTGNGSPGGTCTFTFRVAPEPPESRRTRR
jgi:hypothetical protein